MGDNKPLQDDLGHSENSTLKPSELKRCVHVTSMDKIPIILESGLLPLVGKLSIQANETPGIFMFPSWQAMMDANWLFNEAWPHKSEPALLCVDVRELDIDCEVDYEVICRQPIERNRISVIAPSELDWDKARGLFFKSGGLDCVQFEWSDRVAAA